MSMLIQLTDAGQTLVEAATGPITLDTFKIGSLSGYIPSVSQTDILGTQRYSGVPSDPIVEDGNFIRYSVNLPASLGPFTYGEVALFKGSILFAIGVFDTEMTKIPLNQDLDAGGNVIIDMHLPVTDPNYQMWADVTQANTFKLNVVNGPHLLPKSQGANPNLVMVKPPSSMRPGFMAYTDRIGVWQYENYTRVGTLTVISATTTAVQCSLALATDFLGEDMVYADGEVLIQFNTGALAGHSRYCSRKLTSVTNSQLNLSVGVTAAPVAGDQFHVYVPIPMVAPATDTVAGVTRLMKAANFPSTSDESAATPAYVAQASGGGADVTDAFGS